MGNVKSSITVLYEEEEVKKELEKVADDNAESIEVKIEAMDYYPR